MRREIEKTENREESTVCSLISVDEITLEKKVEDEIRGLVIQMIVIFPKSLLLLFLDFDARAMLSLEINIAGHTLLVSLDLSLHLRVTHTVFLSKSRMF